MAGAGRFARGRRDVFWFGAGRLKSKHPEPRPTRSVPRLLPSAAPRGHALTVGGAIAQGASTARTTWGPWRDLGLAARARDVLGAEAFGPCL